jgi:hypothetical protein
LAFGAPPDSQSSWVANVLEDQRVGFVAKSGNTLIALNESAESLALFS